MYDNNIKFDLKGNMQLLIFSKLNKLKLEKKIMNWTEN